MKRWLAGRSSNAHTGNAAEPELSSSRFGEFEVTAIQDAATTMRRTLFAALPEQEFRRLAGGNEAPASVNVFLLKRNGKRILADTGYGGGRGTLTSNLVNLKSHREKIDFILLTHMHGDHIGGLINAAGEAVFRRRRFWFPLRSWHTGGTLPAAAGTCTESACGIRRQAEGIPVRRGGAPRNPGARRRRAHTRPHRLRHRHAADRRRPAPRGGNPAAGNRNSAPVTIWTRGSRFRRGGAFWISPPTRSGRWQGCTFGPRASCTSTGAAAATPPPPGSPTRRGNRHPLIRLNRMHRAGLTSSPERTTTPIDIRIVHFAKHLAEVADIVEPALRGDFLGPTP